MFDFNAGTLNTLNGSQIVVPTGSNLIIGAAVGGAATWNILGGTNLVGEVAGSTSTTIVGGVAGALGVVTASGAGTVWSNTTDLSVGDASSFNQMTITNGARVMSVNGFIGNAANANSNLVVVAGTNSLWFASGNLVVGGAGISNMLVVGSGAMVDVRGTLRVGPNAQFLNSGNLLSAATEVSAGGQLVVTGGGALGTGAVANSGTLIFNPTGTLTVTNTISGIGNMVGNGPGTLVLVSSNSYTGGTLIAGGTVSLKNTYALGFGPVTLTGGLLKADPLVMNFATYSQSGGTLQMAVGGTTAPGVDYDQVNVAGAATVSGGTLKIVPFGAYQPKRGDAVPLMVAAGGLTGTYPAFDSTSFYAGPTPASALLLPNLSYSATTMTLQWSQLPFLPYAVTPNQQAVARNLDATVTDPRTKAAMDYIDYLPGGVAQVSAAMDLISPHQLIPMFTMGFAGAEVQGYNLLARMREIRAGSSGFSSSGLSFYDPSGTVDGRMGFYDPAGTSGPGPLTHLASSEAGESTRVFKNKPLFLPLKDNPWGVFVSGAGQFVGVQGDHNANGYHVASGGFTVGADYRLMDGTMYPFDQLVIGAALGYANSSSDIGGDGRINVNGAQGNIYTAWFKEGFHVEGMVGGGGDIYDTRRDALGGSATATVNGYHLQGMLGTGYDWQSGPWTFGPQVSAQYTRVMIDSFTESGSLLPLRFDSQNADSLHSRVGAHLTYQAVLGKILLTPEVRAGWRHEFMNPDIMLNSQFANGAGGVFGVRGPALGKDSAVLGVGMSVQWTDDLATFINYDTELGRANYQLHYVNAGVRINL
jgi:outer membrane autotransporter protein